MFDIDKVLYDNLFSHAFRKDYVMYNVLEKFGGVFMDFDTICLKPLDELAYRYSYFSGVEPPVYGPKFPESSVAIIGTSKGHPVAKAMRETFVKYFG